MTESCFRPIIFCRPGALANAARRFRRRKASIGRRIRDAQSFNSRQSILEQQANSTLPNQLERRVPCLEESNESPRCHGVPGHWAWPPRARPIAEADATTIGSFPECFTRALLDYSHVGAAAGAQPRCAHTPKPDQGDISKRRTAPSASAASEQHGHPVGGRGSILSSPNSL